MHLLILALIASVCVFSQSNWKLVKDKNGIKAYTSSVDSSKFKSVKVECDMPGTFEKFIAVLQDVAKHTDWVYETKRAYIVKKVSDDELIYYAETSLPWPISNRDVVIKMVNTKDAANNSLLVTQSAVTGMVDSQRGIVRVTSMDGRYEVKSTGDTLHVVYYLTIDPAGDLPAWVVNMFCTKGPYETFRALTEKMKS